MVSWPAAIVFFCSNRTLTFINQVDDAIGADCGGTFVAFGAQTCAVGARGRRRLGRVVDLAAGIAHD